MKTIEELREIARNRYREKHNVLPEKYHNGRSHPDNIEYYRAIKLKWYYAHKEELSLKAKERYRRKKEEMEKEKLLAIQPQITV